MSTKEHFANSLDRLIYPHIDILTAHPDAKVEAATEKPFNDKVTHIWDAPCGQIEVKWCDGLLVYWNGNLVYEREGGHTSCCRPGPWIIAVYEKSVEHRDATEREELQTADKTARARCFNFEPIVL